MRGASILSFAALAAAGCGYLGLGNDNAAPRIDKRLAAARALLANRDYDGVRREAAAAAELARRNGPNDFRIAEAMSLEGEAALGACANDAARERFEAAVKALEGQADAPATLRARALRGLGGALGRQGELAAAEEALLRAVQAIGKDGKALAERRDLARDLAEIYRWMGRGKAAAAALGEALDFERERAGVGIDTTELATLHCDLGRVDLAVNDWDGAASSFDRANRILKGLRLQKPADAAGAHATLEESWLAVNSAALVLARGQAVRLEPLFEQALRSLETEFNGRPSPWRVAALRDYGSCLLRHGRQEQAERSVKNALAECQRVYGPKHPEVGWTLLVFAEILDATHRADDADRCRKKAGEISAALATFGK